MDDEIVKLLVRKLSSLLAWRDQVQNLAGARESWEYEIDLIKEIDALKTH